MMLAHVFSDQEEMIERAPIQGWSRTTKRGQTHLVGYIDVALVIRLSGCLELVQVDFFIVELPRGTTWENKSC